MPVHKWMLRHVYFPALHAGVPRMWAGTLVFFVSAVFHELLIGLPLHMVRCWAFVGVMSQARPWLLLLAVWCEVLMGLSLRLAAAGLRGRHI